MDYVYEPNATYSKEISLRCAETALLYSYPRVKELL